LPLTYSLSHFCSTRANLNAATENGKLQSYILWIVVFSIAIVSLPFLGQGLTTGTRELTHAPALAIVLWLLLFSSCWMMLWFHHERIKAVLISGAIGLVVTMVFHLLLCA
jgi:multicomponent K+:H+ antiporter subunit A